MTMSGHIICVSGCASSGSYWSDAHRVNMNMMPAMAKDVETYSSDFIVQIFLTKLAVNKALQILPRLHVDPQPV